MAGYSNKPLWQKLGYKEGMKVLVLNSPSSYPELLGETQPSLATVTADEAPHSAVHLFCTQSNDLAVQLTRLRHELVQNGMVWVSWPKKASKKPTDITEDRIRDIALPLGFVDVKVCAVDETWSGLKLVIRTSERV